MLLLVLHHVPQNLGLVLAGVSGLPAADFSSWLEAAIISCLVLWASALGYFGAKASPEHPETYTS
jgi:hypothetical protein